MLPITVQAGEFYDEATQTFGYIKEQQLQLEHSLVSLSKWESKWKKPFLKDDQKTDEELRDYFRCMTITPNVDPMVFKVGLSNQNVRDILAYINDTQTATTISDRRPVRPNREIMTSEIIYCYMITLGIPMECQKWHLSRLLTLIRVCDIKGSGSERMSKLETMKMNAALNAARRAKTGSSG